MEVLVNEDRGSEVIAPGDSSCSWGCGIGHL